MYKWLHASKFVVPSVVSTIKNGYLKKVAKIKRFHFIGGHCTCDVILMKERNTKYE